MKRTPDTSLLKLQDRLKPLTKVVFLIVSFSCQMSTQWSHQKFFSERRSTTRTSTNSVGSASTFWRTSGLLLSRSDLYSCPFKPWCLFQTWMIRWTKRSRMLGKLIRKAPSREPRNGRFSMPTTERPNLPISGESHDEHIRRINATKYKMWIPLSTAETKPCLAWDILQERGLKIVIFDRWKADALKFDLWSLCPRHSKR